MLREGSTAFRLLVVCVVAAMFAGCGNGDGNAEGEPPPAATSQAASTPPDEASVEPTDLETSLSPTPSRARDGSVALTREMVPENTTSFGIEIDQVTMNGVDYPAAVLLVGDRNVAKIEINAGRRYERFRGSLSVPDDEDSDSAFQVDISLDGGDPTFSTLVKFGETKEIDLKIDQVLRIKIEFVAVGNDDGRFGIGNPRFN